MPPNGRLGCSWASYKHCVGALCNTWSKRPGHLAGWALWGSWSQCAYTPAHQEVQASRAAVFVKDWSRDGHHIQPAFRSGLSDFLLHHKAGRKWCSVCDTEMGSPQPPFQPSSQADAPKGRAPPPSDRGSPDQPCVSVCVSTCVCIVMGCLLKSPQVVYSSSSPWEPFFETNFNSGTSSQREKVSSIFCDNWMPGTELNTTDSSRNWLMCAVSLQWEDPSLLLECTLSVNVAWFPLCKQPSAHGGHGGGG